jgi:hypothetical protein
MIVAQERKFPVVLGEGEGAFVLRRLNPSGILSLFKGEVLTTAHAALITERVMPLAATYSEPNKIVIVHDWRKMTSYDSAARTNLTAWAVDHFREVLFTGIVISGGNKIVSMGLHVAASALALVGLRLTIDTSVEQLLMRARLSLAATR